MAKVRIIKRKNKNEIFGLRKAIRLDEISKDFRKKYKLIGRGATSLVFNTGKRVLIFTRDAIKADWLTQNWGLGLGKDVTSKYEDILLENPSLNDLNPIFIIEMPRLQPLKSGDRKLINQIKKDIFELIDNKNDPAKYYGILNKVMTKYYKLAKKNKTYKYISRFVDFLANYDPEQYLFDLRPANFLRLGKYLVPLDPLLDSSLYKYISSR